MSDAIRDAVYLRIGGAVGIPPANTKAIFADADGSVKILDTAAAKSALDSAVGSCGTWPAQQFALIRSLMPTLTGYQYIKAAQQPISGAAPSTNDGAAEGGGRTGTNATLSYLSGSVFQLPKTGRGAFAFRCKIAAIAGGNTAAVGLANAAGNHDVLIGMVGSTSTTNYSMSIDGAVSTTDDFGVANDTGWHTFVCTFDTVNVKVYVDGTLRATRAITTNLVDESTYLIMFNTTSGQTVWTECLYAYVAP